MLFIISVFFFLLGVFTVRNKKVKKFLLKIIKLTKQQNIQKNKLKYLN